MRSYYSEGEVRESVVYSIAIERYYDYLAIIAKYSCLFVWGVSFYDLLRKKLREADIREVFKKKKELSDKKVAAALEEMATLKVFD